MNELLQKINNKEWRMSNLYKIRNKQKESIIFKRNKAQVHFNQNKHTRNIILKSRQLGFTTDEAIDALDDTLFNRNFDALMIAHDLESATSIFDKKIDYAWDNFKLQSLYSLEMDQSKTLKFGFGDGTFSSIAVDTSGRSGTYQRVHVTELGLLAKKYPDKANEIITGTIPAIPTNGRCDIESTSQGAEGLFYNIFWDAWVGGEPKSPMEFKAHFYGWQWDEEIDVIVPEVELPKEFLNYQRKFNLNDKEITYYYQKWLSLNKNWQMLQREYPTIPEEAFTAILEGVVYSEQIGKARDEKRIKFVAHDSKLKVHTVWDMGVGPNMSIGFYQHISNEMRMIDYWEGTEKDGLPQACKAVKDKPYIYGKHFGPHDIEVTDQSTGVTRKKTAKTLGIDFTIIPNIGVDDGLNAGKLMWSRLWVCNVKCLRWIELISKYRWEWDDKRGTYKDKPYHDKASHAGDLQRYTALVEDKMTNENEDEVTFNQPRFETISAIEPTG